MSTDTQSDHDFVIYRFDTVQGAEKYSSRLIGTPRDKREKRCLLHALRDSLPGSSVLDLPCGTGRLLGFLLELGFKVHEADSSAHMIEQARQRRVEMLSGSRGEVTGFSVEDVLQTSFANDSFDVVICNRLFHHFVDAETRIQAMQELGRICKGAVVLSFFNVATLSALRTRIKDRLRRRVRHDRLPLSLDTLIGEARQAGLELVESIPSRGRLSQQWYVVLKAPE